MPAARPSEPSSHEVRLATRSLLDDADDRQQLIVRRKLGAEGVADGKKPRGRRSVMSRMFFNAPSTFSASCVRPSFAKM
jgi:hypothetical protein